MFFVNSYIFYVGDLTGYVFLNNDSTTGHDVSNVICYHDVEIIVYIVLLGRNYIIKFLVR